MIFKEKLAKDTLLLTASGIATPAPVPTLNLLVPG